MWWSLLALLELHYIYTDGGFIPRAPERAGSAGMKKEGCDDYCNSKADEGSNMGDKGN